MKKLFLSVTALLFLSLSCSKVGFQEQNEAFSKKKYPLEVSPYDKTKRILSDNEIAEIGISHNDFLAELLVKQNGDRIFTSSELKNNAISKYPDLTDHKNVSDLIVDESASLGINDFNLLIDNNTEFFNNPDLLKHYVYQSALLTDEYSNYNDFIHSLNSLELSARKVLLGVDLDTYLVFSSVYKNSTKFWFDESNHINYPERAVNKVALADGLSASIGFITLAAVTSAVALSVGSGGLAVPAIIIVMELIGIGFAAALSSAAVILGIG